ncbi:MAG: family 78 glycoside hydrolase catalytic domain, partial [bacterium]
MSTLKINEIRCEYKVNPIGIDIEKPRFSWKIDSKARGVRQESFAIQVAEDKEFNDLVWNEERNSEETTNIEYKGQALKARNRYYYRIKVESNQGSSGWSQPNYFEMGILDHENWQAEWITPNYDYDPQEYEPVSLLRKEFLVMDKIKKARAYVTGLGLYELRINGKKVGEDYLTPGWTSYNKRVQYQSYDLSDYLVEGSNAVGMMLGDGWYLGDLMWEDTRNFYGKKRLALVEIEIEYESGKEIIISDQSWKSSKSPILMSEIYHGEKYDAGLEKTGWDQPEFNDFDWHSVKEVEKSKEVLVAQENTPVRKMMKIDPQEIITTPAGEKVIDMGQNMVGWLKFKLEGNKGDKVVLKHAEVLDKEGNFYTDNIRSADQKIEYILKGEGEEVFEPHFTFQGFRYVKVVEYPGEINLDDFKGIVLYSDLKQTVDFECSNE